MSSVESKLVAPLWAYRHPPNDLTNEWQTKYLVLLDPAIRVAVFSPDRARRGTCELFEAWSDTLRRSTMAASAVLDSLHGRGPRTWRAGHTILKAVAPTGAALSEATRFLAFPRDVVREGGTAVQPTRHGRQGTADALRAGIADRLSGFLDLVVPLLDELAAAVVADCAAQQGRPTGSKAAEALADDTIYYLGRRAYRVGDGEAQTVTEREDCILRSFIGNLALDSAGLSERSGLKAEAVAAVVGRLRKKYGGRFRDALTAPGGKGQGGYRAEVVDARPPKPQE
jgi:hypothetical protein